LFDDLAYDLARRKAAEIADYIRAHGPFEPHRLPIEDIGYTTLPNVLKKLEGRFEATE
jgi:fructose 1,6-bisphosphate aldolase/phosphatase